MSSTLEAYEKLRAAWLSEKEEKGIGCLILTVDGVTYEINDSGVKVLSKNGEDWVDPEQEQLERLVEAFND